MKYPLVCVSGDQIDLHVRGITLSFVVSEAVAINSDKELLQWVLDHPLQCQSDEFLYEFALANMRQEGDG